MALSHRSNLRLEQNLSPSLKGSWYQPTKKTDWLSGAHRAWRAQSTHKHILVRDTDKTEPAGADRDSPSSPVQVRHLKGRPPARRDSRSADSLNKSPEGSYWSEPRPSLPSTHSCPGWAQVQFHKTHTPPSYWGAEVVLRLVVCVLVPLSTLAGDNPSLLMWSCSSQLHTAVCAHTWTMRGSQTGLKTHQPANQGA